MLDPHKPHLWPERVLAYALPLSPPIAALLALILSVSRRAWVRAFSRDRWTVWAFAAIMALGTVSAFLSLSPGRALQGLAAFAMLSMMWLTGRLAIFRPERFWVDLQRGIGIVAVLTWAIVLFQVHVQWRTSWIDLTILTSDGRAMVLGLGANGLGPLLAYGSILALGRFLTSSSPWSRLEALTLSCVSLAAALAIGVRNALWGAIVGAVALLPVTGLTGVLGLVIVLLIGTATIVVRPNHLWVDLLRLVEQGLDPAHWAPDEQARWVTWKSAVKMIQDHPAFGVGPFHFRESKLVYAPQSDPDVGPHNIYLRVAAEWGLPAAVLLFTWLASWSVRLWHQREDRWRWTLVAGLAGFLAMGLFDDPLFTLHISGPVFAGLGLACATSRPDSTWRDG